MELDVFDHDSTGYTGDACRAMTVSYDRYEVTLRLGPNGEFRGILDIEVRKDFLTPEQKMNAAGYHDVSDLYEIEQP